MTAKKLSNVVADVNVHHEGVILYAGQRQIEKDLPTDIVEALIESGGAHIEKES